MQRVAHDYSHQITNNFWTENFQLSPLPGEAQSDKLALSRSGTISQWYHSGHITSYNIHCRHVAVFCNVAPRQTFISR